MCLSVRNNLMKQDAECIRNMKMEYLVLYLIRWPVNAKPGHQPIPLSRKTDFLLMSGMEKCQGRGLEKTIGVSNFTSKKLAELLAFAAIPHAVNQASSEQLVYEAYKVLDVATRSSALFKWLG